MAATVVAEHGIKTLLASGSALAAVIGTRIHYGRLPQNPTYPALVYQRISSDRAHSQQGGSGLDLGLWQFTVWGPDATQNLLAIEELRLLVQGYMGTVVTTAGSVDFRGWLLVQQRDVEDPAGSTNEANTSMLGVQVDYQINVWEQPTGKVTS